jgi:hypothetical protein
VWQFSVTLIVRDKGRANFCDFFCGDLPPVASHPFLCGPSLTKAKARPAHAGRFFSHCTTPYESELSTVWHSTKKAPNYVERFCFWS